jgi:hypothetical protein
MPATATLDNPQLLTPAWTPLRYHPVQHELWQTAINRKKRFIAAVAGRRSGKTEMARRFIVLSLAYKRQYGNPLYAYCLPTYMQARKVAWYPILSLIPQTWIAQPNGINKSESSITTIFGSTLYIVGMDKPQRIEGIPLDGVVIDEASDQRPELFRKTLIPMLSERNGWCWRIGVPKRSGVGRVDYRMFFEAGLDPQHPTQASFHWRSADILTPQQIEEAKQQLDPQEFSEQFEAEWIDVGGTVYYNFSRANITDNVNYIPGERIIVGCDFNVSPMCWTLAHFIEGRLLIFDEIFLKDTNTPSVLDHLHQKYGMTHGGEWTFIGDASARARKTSATRTDYLTIKNDIRFGHKKVYFPAKNPHIRDRIACVNAGFCNALGDRRILVHPRCKKLINDLMVMTYQEASSELENYAGTDIGHMADALGYAVFNLMPIKLNKIFVPTVVTYKGDS